MPIYIADTLKAELPNKACTRGKPYAEWKEMDAEDFLFSLYPNDLIRVTSQKGLTLSKAQKESTLPDTYETKQEMLYYTSASINTAAVACRTHDNSYEIKSMGITILLVEQNAKMALGVSDRGYVLETGKIVLSGTQHELLTNEQVKNAYLGG